MQKIIILLIIAAISIKIINSSAIINKLNAVDNRDGDTKFFKLHVNNFRKMFRHTHFMTISIDSHKLFSTILRLISSTKSIFLINNKYCFNNIINVNTNYFINSYYENDEAPGRRKRDTFMDAGYAHTNKTLSYRRLINLHNKNGGFIFEVTNFNSFEYIINCYLTPGGTYLFIINNGNLNTGNSSDYNMFEDYFLDDIIDNNNNNGITLNDMEVIFHEIWTHYQNYKIFIYLNRQIYTYNPFYFNMTLSRYGKIIVNGSDSVTEGGEYLSEINLKKLNGYPVNIEIFTSTYVIEMVDWKTGIKNIQGADLEVARTLRRVMNYTSITQAPDIYVYGFCFSNGTCTGTLGHVIRRSSDIGLVGLFIKDYLTRNVEFTASVYSDQLCLVVPKAKRIPSSLLPMLCFTRNLWITILVIVLAASIFWCLIRRINDSIDQIVNRLNRSGWIMNDRRRQYYQIFVDMLILIASAPMRRFTRVTSERCFVISICLISVVFVSIFQSKLATVFIEPVYYKDIVKLQDMKESQLKIAIKYPAQMEDMFPANSTPLMNSLRKKLYLMDPKGPPIIAMMERGSKIASVVRLSKTKLDMAHTISNQLIFVVPECPKSYNLAYIMTRASVFLEPVNDILLHLLNGGLINKWIGDMYFNQTMADIRQNGVFYAGKFKILNLTDLQLGFNVWGAGTIVSVILFVFELNFNRIYQIYIQ